MAAIAKALDALACLPDGLYLTVNCSPSTACGPALPLLLEGHRLDRLVLEITEQERFDDVEALKAALQPLRALGLRLAVDDTGAGYAGLQQILLLRPDIIKLDRFVVRAINRGPSRRALAAALAVFAAEVGCQIVAEGVEVAEGPEALRALGLETVQGYLLGRPASLADALASTRADADRHRPPMA